MENISKSLDINQIKQYLPHRYPMLLVDRVLTWESGKTITAIKNVTEKEFFNGPVSDKPVMQCFDGRKLMANCNHFVVLNDGTKT